MFKLGDQVTPGDRFILRLAQGARNPRNMLTGAHDRVAEIFREQRSRVTLRYMSFEPPGAHSYRPLGAIDDGNASPRPAHR